MVDEKFYIQRYAQASNGAYVRDGKERSLEDDFGFCRYKSMTGINARGKQKGFYVETYTEANSARVWFSETAKREQITSMLTIYVFGSDPGATTEKTLPEQILFAENSWNELCDWLENHFLLWHDNQRQRKALFYLSEAIEPTSVIKGVPYLLCQIKLTNVFGKTFPMEDNTIEDWLSSGGKEVGL